MLLSEVKVFTNDVGHVTNIEVVKTRPRLLQLLGFSKTKTTRYSRAMDGAWVTGGFPVDHDELAMIQDAVLKHAISVAFFKGQ